MYSRSLNQQVSAESSPLVPQPLSSLCPQSPCLLGLVASQPLPQQVLPTPGSPHLPHSHGQGQRRIPRV